MIRKLLNGMRELWVMLGLTLLFILGIEFIAWIGFGLSDVWNNRGMELVDPRLQADVYLNQEWARDYWIEARQTIQTQHAEWHPYVYWRRAPFQGQYINVDENGVRLTWNATPAPTGTQIKIAMFGGSALWGTGARNHYTIPSLVSQRVKAKGVDAWVTNYGEDGYVSTQQVIALIVELQKGNVPDVVVFYDGANDVYSAIQQGVAGLPQNEFNREEEFNKVNWRRAVEQLSLYRFAAGLARSSTRSSSATDTVRLANSVLDIYSVNLQVVRSLARQYGFATVSYWQPTIYTKNKLPNWEQQQRDASFGSAFFEQVHQLFEQRGMASEAGGMYDLSDIFDAEPDSVFIDPFHISEAGNDRVASSIVDTLPLSAGTAR